MEQFKRKGFLAKALLYAGLIGVSSAVASADTCMAGSLNMYTGLGSGGCNIGALQFTGFALLPGSFTQIDPMNVFLTPTESGFLVGFNASASAGQTLQSTFSFMASGATFLTGTVGLIGSSVTPDGANTGVGTFNANTIAIPFDLGGGISQLTDTVSLAGASSVATQLDFVIDGGPTGAASLQQGSVAFTSRVPEPSATTILSLSACLGLALKRRHKTLVTARETQ